MSFIGATGLDEVQEQFDILQENIDANASYINNLVGIPDPTHTAVFGINILNPGLFGLVERAEVNIAALQTGEEGLTTQVEGIETQITGIEGEITGIEGQIAGIQGEISTIQFTELPAIVSSISAVAGVAGDALGKANKSLGIWDEDGNNTYNMKSGNVAIGILPKGTLLNNKLEVNGSINIPTGSKYKINNVDLSYNDLTDKLIGSLEQNIIGLDNNELIINDKPDSSTIGDVFIPLTANNEPILLTAERSYPPIRNFTLGNQTLSGEPYGNGTYIMTWSTSGSGGSPANCFNTANTIAGSWGAGQYNNGLYIGSAFVVADYLGDWLKIQLPVPIILTSIAFIMRVSTIALQDRAPRDYKIYGSNDGTNWVELISKIGAVYNTQFIHEETTSQTTAYSHYALAVNKLNVGATSLNFDEWYIYGKEIITAVPEGNPITHKTFSLIHNPITLTHDFTNFNDFTSWNNYASSKGMVNAGITTYDAVLDAVNNPTGTSSLNYRLPPHYNFVSVSYGNPSSANNVVVRINNIDVSSCTPGQFKTHSQSYNKYDLLTILEGTSIMSANIIITLSNSSLNTYSLSVQAGTSIQINNQTAQYLSGDYIINVGATQSSVLGLSGQTNPYPLQNGSSIDVKYSMTQKTTGTINYKKDGFIKYTPASAEYPTTGNWEILDIDAQPLIQFGGNLPINRIDGNLPANRLDNIDMSKVATGNLDWSRIASKPLLSDLGGTLSYNSLTDKLTAGTNISIVNNAINNTLIAGTNISIVGNAINNTLPFTTIAHDIFTTNLNNFGIGNTLPVQKLDVNGSINIALGSKYKINNIDLSYNDLTNKLTAGDRITIANNVITAEAPYASEQYSGRIPIREYGSGVLNYPANFAFTLDGITIKKSTLQPDVPNNVIYVPQPDWNQDIIGGSGYIYNKPTLFDGNYNSLTNKLTAGNNISIVNNAINNTLPIVINANDIYTTNTGNVGIGTSILNNKLEVSGSINIPTGSKYKINNVPLSYSDIAGTPPVSSKWTNATDVATNIYYSTGNVGIGITTSINNKLEVGGNLNISAGSKYKINNVNLAFSDLGGTLSYNSLTDKLTAGTNISIVGNAINNTYTYTLPTAGVGAGGTLGGVKVDGTTINITNGVISAVSTASGASISLDGGVNNRSYGWTGSTSLLGRVGVAGTYAIGSLVEDVVLRSQGRLLLQSGTNNPALTIETTTNNILVRNSIGIGTTTISSGSLIDVGGFFKVAFNAPADALTLTSSGVQIYTALNVSGTIRFGGFSDDNDLNLATIQNREYATNKSELLIFKGDNIEGSTGVDRIRLRAGAIAFDTFATDATSSATAENIRMYIAGNGNVGIGSTIPNYKLEVNGVVNATEYRVNGASLNLNLSQGMSVQTKHLTYTQMDIKNNTGWEAINDDLSTGFVIAITPTNTASKVLLNMIAHIGCVYSGDNRWWGLKLYRKIGTGAWTEITGANGTETGAAANTAGTPVWITHNTGMTDSFHDYTLQNVSGTYLDAPNTTSIVYYTIYWNSRVGDNPNPANTMYINRSTRQGDDAWRPAPSSSLTATEIWDLGTPYTPPTGSGSVISILGNNVGIGTNSPSSLLHLHTTAIDTQVRLQLTDGTTTSGSNSGLAIYKGSDQNGYFWNYQYNSLIFGTNNLQRMVITADAGNVGIGTTNPTGRLHLHRENPSASESVGLHFTDTLTGRNASDGFYISKGSDNDAYIYNNENNAIKFGTGGVEAVRIEADGNLLVKAYGVINSGTRGIFFRDGFVSTNKYNCSILTFDHSGGGANDGISINGYGGVSICTGSNTRQERVRISSTGVVSLPNYTWHGCLNGNARFYFSPSNTTYIRGHGNNSIELRNAGDNTLVKFNNTDIQYFNGGVSEIAKLDYYGNWTCNLVSFSGSGHDWVGVLDVNTSSLQNNYRTLRGMISTFTGYHRCYIEDELFNEEDVDIFRNEYVGRIVISTGKIKTDMTLKREGDEDHKWYSLENKEGITIEDALPIVQLSRVRKDKRVYGVLGDPKRSSNNKCRITINGCGEGAMCVANTNGNIENGDYIQTSDLLGYGEKQDDDLHRNYTIAKAVMDCNFELDNPNYECKELSNGTRVAMIACVYKAS